MARRTVRGIRDTLPPGTLIGRRSGGGAGAPQLITLRDLIATLAAIGITTTPGGGAALPQYISSSVDSNGNTTITTTVGSTTTTQTIAGSGAVALLNGIPANVTHLDLPAGSWDVSGNVTFVPGPGMSTFTQAIAALSLVSGQIPPPPNGGGYVEQTGTLSPTQMRTTTTATMRIVLASPAPVWLVAQATYS